jgi:hypothetical protein
MKKKNRRVSCVLPVLSDYTAKATSYVYRHLVISSPPTPQRLAPLEDGIVGGAIIGST